MAASLAARPPGIGMEREVSTFKGTIVDRAGDAAHRRDLLIAQTCLLPGFLERAALQQQVDAPDIASFELRVEGALRIGKGNGER